MVCSCHFHVCSRSSMAWCQRLRHCVDCAGIYAGSSGTVRPNVRLGWAPAASPDHRDLLHDSRIGRICDRSPHHQEHSIRADYVFDSKYRLSHRLDYPSVSGHEVSPVRSREDPDSCRNPGGSQLCLPAHPEGRWTRMSLHIFHPRGRSPERLYIYNVLLKEFLGLDFVVSAHNSPVVEIHSSDAPGKKLIVLDRLFSTPDEAWLTPASLPHEPLSRYQSESGSLVPILYGAADPTIESEPSENEVRINVDIFGGAFFMLTRYEEMAVAERDHYDRFPYSASLAARQDFLGIPVVNEYLELLWRCMSRLWPGLKRAPRDFRVLVSHDVDLMSQVGLPVTTLLRSVGADLLLRRQPFLGLRRIAAHLIARSTGTPSENDPYDSFDWIMKMSEACGVRSTFNFVPHRNKGRYDPRYDLDQPFVRDVIQRIAA